MKQIKNYLTYLLILVLIFFSLPIIAEEIEEEIEEVLTGYIRVTVSGDGYLYFDGASRSAGVKYEVPVGSYTVSLSKFGWESDSKTVRVKKGRTTRVNLSLGARVAFELGISATLKRFNPENHGALGETKFAIHVTTPGSGILEIRDQNGNQVFKKEFDRLAYSPQWFAWNGRNVDGNILPDGLYTAHFEGQPSEGWKIASSGSAGSIPTSLRDETQIIIDTSLFYPLGTIGTGGTSMGGISSVRLLPQGTDFFSATGAASFTVKPDFEYVLPFFIYYGFTPLSWLEISFNLGFEVASPEFATLFIGSSLKFAGQIGPLHLGGLFRYTYTISPSKMPEFTEAGLGFGILAGMQAGPIFISFSEEVVLDRELGIRRPLDGHLKTGLSTSFQKDLFATSAWATLYSPFDENAMKAFDMVSFGIDFSFFSPVPFITNIGVGYTYNQASEHDIFIRFGWGALFL